MGFCKVRVKFGRVRVEFGKDGVDFGEKLKKLLVADSEILIVDLIFG